MDGINIPRPTDEGRAMLQIIHDVAPGAELAFTTGFISPGNFAQGIVDLANVDCDIIVDDITYITEPFFKDGIVAQAVEVVSDFDKIYVSAAGNYGANSYTGVFDVLPGVDLDFPIDTMSAPHDFGGGDYMQQITLVPGVYTVAMQWDDNYFSLNEGGAQYDLDIHLIDCLLYTSPSPRDRQKSRMPSSA